MTRKVQQLDYLARQHRANEEDVRREIVRRQRLCRHRLKRVLQYPIPMDDGRGQSRWWLHFVCTKCDHAYTINYDVPLCPTCEMPLVLYKKDTKAAKKAYKLAQESDPCARKVYVLRCGTCRVLHGFATRIEIPKPKRPP